MDALTFLRLLLPDEGYKFLVKIKPTGKVIHKSFTSLTEMADAAMAEGDKGENIYFACSTYKDVTYRTLESGFRYETRGGQHMVLGAKSLWLDIDVGKDDKTRSYDTQDEAKAAIKYLVARTGLPMPMVVSSGNGFHCYWLFDELVPSDKWEEIARLWRMVTKEVGIKIDPSRDIDSSSILRIPGTRNPKGDKLVKVVKQTEAKPYSAYVGLFKSFLGDKAIDLRKPLGNQITDGEQNANFPQSSLEKVSQHCQTIKWFKDTGASDSEPAWRACLGIAKYCVDGEGLAHQWSSADPRYDYGETQAKLDGWTKGPSLCETMRDTCASCQGCAHSVKTPVQLGYLEVPVEPPQPEDAPKEKKPDYQQHWPQGYQALGGRMVRMVPDEDGVVHPVSFAYPVFYPVDRIRQEDGTYAMVIEMHVKQGVTRQFDLPLKTIVDAKTLKIAMAANEIIIINPVLAMDFLQSYSDRMRQHMEELNTFNQFGWTADRSGVLLGDTLFTKNGRRKVRLSARLSKNPDLVAMFDLKGTKESWCKGVDELYNRPNAEPHQYAIITQFGAWLCPLMESEEWNGIPLSLYSKDSGYGKSTATKIALNAFLNASKTTVTNMTPLAVIGRASIMGSVPTLYDEVTDNLRTGEDTTQVLYALSNGRARVGMQADGKERDPMPPFKQMSTFTGNKDQLYKITEAKVNPEAAQMRILEIDLQEYGRLESLVEGSELHHAHAPIVEHLLNNTCGVLADEYFGFLLENTDDIRLRLEKLFFALKRRIGDGGGNAAKERFYARHIACALVGGMIAKKLGYIKFDLEHLLEWILAHVTRLRGYAQEMVSTTEDKIAKMMSDFTGHMIVTNNFDKLDVRSGKVEEPILQLRGPAKVRVVLGKDGERGRIIVSVAAMDEWCRQNDENSTELRKALVQEGFMRRGMKAKPTYLARGIKAMPIGQQRCVELEYVKMQGILSDVDNVFSVAETVANEHEIA